MCRFRRQDAAADRPSFFSPMHAFVLFVSTRAYIDPCLPQPNLPRCSHHAMQALCMRPRARVLLNDDDDDDDTQVRRGENTDPCSSSSEQQQQQQQQQQQHSHRSPAITLRDQGKATLSWCENCYRPDRSIGRDIYAALGSSSSSSSRERERVVHAL